MFSGDSGIGATIRRDVCDYPDEVYSEGFLNTLGNECLCLPLSDLRGSL